MSFDKNNPTYQALLETVPTLTEALERTFRLGGFRSKEMAHRMGHRYADFVRYFNPNDNRYLPTDDIERLIRESGNLFALDWLERRFGRCAYPLEMMAILDEIRRSLLGEGRTVRFALRPEQTIVSPGEGLLERLILLAGKER